MMIVKANKDSEAGVMPSKELIEQMGRFNEEMVKAGVMLSGDGLQSSSKGARVFFTKGAKPQVVDGPFAETKELIAGFWIIQVKSKEEAIQWALRCPAPHGEGQDGQLELRQIFESADFAEIAPEEVAREEILRKEAEKNAARK